MKKKKTDIDHSNCKINSYETMTPNIEQLKASLKAIESNINDLKSVIDGIKARLDVALRIFKRYHYIAKDIIGKYELFNNDLKNHRIIKSL